MMRDYFSLVEKYIYEYKKGRLFQYAHFKRDGWSVQFGKDADGNCKAYSRKRHEITSSQDWMRQLQESIPPNSCVLGELFVEGGESTDVASVISEEPKHEGKFEIYAAPVWEGVCCFEHSLQAVANMVRPSHPFIKFQVGLPPTIPDGYEGFVLKTNHFPKFPYDWMKLKESGSCDLRVKGFEAGKGKYQGKVGSVICASDKGTLFSTFSGFSDEIRDHMTQYPSWWIGRIIEVKYGKILRSGKLRHPQYSRVRYDKDNTTERENGVVL